MELKIILIYIFIISFFSVIVCVSDKKKAIKGKRRISEKTLFILSFFGGATAMYLTMLKVRHKTKHKRFMIGLPVIILFHFAVCIFARYILDRNIM